MGHDVAKSDADGKRLDTTTGDAEKNRRPPVYPESADAWPRPGQSDITGILLAPEKRAAVIIEAREWDLVLTARRIPHFLKRQGAGWRLYVPQARVDEAVAEISDYADERANRPLFDPEAEPIRPPVWLEVLALVGLLTGIFGLLLGGARPFGLAIPWRELGAGDTGAMLAGQWWRAVTALSLHADPAHLIGNAACGALFLGLLCRETGVGLGFALCLAGGACGNVAKALIQGQGIHFLGASTAVFAALGALGAVRFASQGPSKIPVARSMTVGAVLMLLAMLGAGSEETGTVDLAGHLLGFTAGALFGLAAGRRLDRRTRPGPLVQTAFGLASAAGLLGAWAWALAGWKGW